MIISKEFVPLIKIECRKWDGTTKEEYIRDPDFYTNSLKYGSCYALTYLKPNNDPNKQTNQVLVDNESELFGVIKWAFEEDNAVCAYVEYQMTQEESDDPFFKFNNIAGSRRTYSESYRPKVSELRVNISGAIDRTNYNNVQLFKEKKQ